MLKSNRTRVPDGKALMLAGLTVSLPVAVGCAVGSLVGVRVAVAAGGTLVAVAETGVAVAEGVPLVGA